MHLTILSTDRNRLQNLQSAVNTVTGITATSKLGAADALSTLPTDAIPDVLLVDAPTSATLEAIQALTNKRPGMQTIILSADQSPGFLMAAMRAGAREIIVPAEERARLTDVLVRARTMHVDVNAPKRAGRVIGVMPCKGGAGATFFATNLAYALAAECSQRVALLDLNLRFGDAALHLSDKPAPSDVAELCEHIQRLDGALLDSSMLEVLPNFGVLAAPEDPAHVANVHPEHVEAIINLVRTRYDVLVVDMGRSFDGPTLRALDMADTIYCVLQMSLPHVRAGHSLLSVFRSLGYPMDKIKFVVNRFAKGGDLNLADVAKALSHAVSLSVPNNFAAVSSSVNLGIPLVKSQRSNPVSQGIMAIAQEIAPISTAPPKQQTRWLTRLLGNNDEVEPKGIRKPA